MFKLEEITNPKSCLNKAKPNEAVFVLLARDPAAPAAILAWIAERARLGLESFGDAKLRDAYNAAAVMEVQRKGGVVPSVGVVKPSNKENEL